MDYRTRMKLAFGGVLFVLVILSSVILRPFITAIASGLLLGFIFFPLQKRLLTRLKKPNLSAAIVTLLVVFVLLVPASFLGKGALKQAQAIYPKLEEGLRTSLISSQQECGDEATSLKCWMNMEIAKVINQEDVNSFLDPAFEQVATWLWTKAPTLLLAVPIFLLNLIIALLVMFTTLVDGEKMVKKVRDFIPLSRKDERVMFKRVHQTVHALIYGHIFGAVAQALAGTIGLFIIGIGSPLFWGSLMMLTALIPFVGAPFIWIPLSIGLFLTGSTVQAIIYLLWGFIVISSVDNIIRTVVVSDRTHMSLVVIFLGIIGGVVVFGVPGFIFGPLILSVTATVLEIYPDSHTAR